MGGRGSGGGRLSDEEKKAKGTFKQSRSEAVYDARAAAKVITGPWLTKIPEPTIPLNEIGRAKYDEFTKLLFDGNKLTTVTCGDCERYAVMHQQMHARLAKGEMVPQQLLNAMNSISVRLRIAENAAPIANPNEKKRFAGAGFSNRRSSPFTLRPHRPTGTGEL